MCVTDSVGPGVDFVLIVIIIIIIRGANVIIIIMHHVFSVVMVTSCDCYSNDCGSLSVVSCSCR